MSSTGQEELPPPIPPAEMAPEELARIVDEGRLPDLENALREQIVRLPAVLAELDRVIEGGLGNLAAAIATMLIARFHVARADKLADRVLSLEDTAGADELADLAAALMQQERLSAADRAAGAAIERDAHNGRARYLAGRIAARRGDLDRAFEQIARVEPRVLGAHGLIAQARYAALTGRTKALIGALSAIEKHATEQDGPARAELDRLLSRLELTGIDVRQPRTLRTSMAIEYASLLVEVAANAEDRGRFGMEVMKFGDIGPLIDRTIDAIRALGLPLTQLYHANEDGEIVAAAIAERTGLDYRQWRHEREVEDGAWLCMASAATHPHLGRIDVDALQRALDDGRMRTLALILPVGWRAPLVPDVIGRLTRDDELPWAIDDEVDEMVELIFDEREEADDDAAKDDAVLTNFIERFAGIFRATQPEPRPPHVAFLDET